MFRKTFLVAIFVLFCIQQNKAEISCVIGIGENLFSGQCPDGCQMRVYVHRM